MMKYLAIVALALPSVALAQQYEYPPQPQPQMPSHWESFDGQSSQIPVQPQFRRAAVYQAAQPQMAAPYPQFQPVPISEPPPAPPSQYRPRAAAAYQAQQPQQPQQDEEATAPQPQPQCATGTVFIVAPDNTTTRKEVTMCRNELGLWQVHR